jgi:hypothetical protein
MGAQTYPSSASYPKSSSKKDPDAQRKSDGVTSNKSKDSRGGNKDGSLLIFKKKRPDKGK